ncbi:MAG: transporter substrate-binding domain-containing protein [Clostridia bacterium]|nr:transporter substrate-binding domain-containing protein [Clostridia bacterium]
MKKLLVLALALLLAATAFGCGTPTTAPPAPEGTDAPPASTAEPATGKVDAIKAAGKLVVYTDPNFAPFEFHGEDGKVAGVDIEIAKAIAAELGVEAEFVEGEFLSLISAVKGGKGDISISGFTITEERRESVDFSDPYIDSVQYLILREDSEIGKMEDLAGLKVGVAAGYTGKILMEEEIDDGVLVDSNTTIVEFRSAVDAMLDLKNGRIDAVVMDEGVAKNIVAENEGIKTIELQYEDGEVAYEQYGVVVAQGNDDLLAVINGVIANLLGENKIHDWLVEYSAADE